MRQRHRRAASIRSGVLLASLATLVCATTVAAEELRLEHIGRYNHQAVGRDHLVGAIPIGGPYAMTCSYDALRVIDLSALPSGQGSLAFVSELRGHDVYSLVQVDETHVLANLRLGGFGVVRVDSETKAIQWLQTIAEPGVFYEGMALEGNRLYVAAHADGIRVFDISDVEHPALIGSLATGFSDAFAIAPAGNVAYVADGAGGLKIVDVANPAAMRIRSGERVDGGALGTAEDVLLFDDRVYVAAGSAGILSYPLGGAHSRVRTDTPGIAKSMTVVGEFIALADITGFSVWRPIRGGELERIAGESGLHRQLPTGNLTLRLWHGVAGWGDDRILVANWDAVDLYQVVPLESSTQPDATVSDQRLRFRIDGGTINVKLSNHGSGPLNVGSITSSAATFTVSPQGPLTLSPGETVPLTITHVPGSASQGLVLVNSNDPDEPILPIEVYGDTPFLDPGDAAIPFTLPVWTFDHVSKTFQSGTFNLADHLGKVICFQVFGTWCPACLPVVVDYQNSVVAPFADHPQVVVALMSQKEQASVLEEYWSNLYLRAPVLFDLPGSISYIAYAQPPSGLPFSRGFLIGPDQTVEATWFSSNADRAVDAIRRQLALIAIPGDANLDGHVDGADYQAVLDAWGPCGDPTFCPADLNDDGLVDGLDVAVVREHFGESA